MAERDAASAPVDADTGGQGVHPGLAGELSGPVEALLLMADEPLTATTLASVLEVPVEVVEQTLRQLQVFYDETGRGFELRHLAGGWRYWTRPEHAAVITRAVLEGQQSRLSQAALETLAVVAYLQPISRARVSAVRGVNVDGVVRTLLAREMIEEAGQDQVTGAVVFRTTETFLERIGLESLEQLPDLAPHLPDASALEAELGQLAAPGPGPVPDPLPTDEDAATDGATTDQPPDAPVSEDPVTDDPVTDGPVTDDPVTDERVTDDPVTTRPAADDDATGDGATSARTDDDPEEQP